MDPTERVEIQIALGCNCKPLEDRLAACQRSGSDCTKELRMLSKCRIMSEEPLGPLKPSKRLVSEQLVSEQLVSSYVEAEDCSGPLHAVKECIDKRHDARFCASQLQDFKTCKMMLENKRNVSAER